MAKFLFFTPMDPILPHAFLASPLELSAYAKRKMSADAPDGDPWSARGATLSDACAQGLLDIPIGVAAFVESLQLRALWHCWKRPSGPTELLERYLLHLPGYVDEKDSPLEPAFSDTTHQQHGYLLAMLHNAFGGLSAYFDACAQLGAAPGAPDQWPVDRDFIRAFSESAEISKAAPAATPRSDPSADDHQKALRL